MRSRLSLACVIWVASGCSSSGGRDAAPPDSAGADAGGSDGTSTDAPASDAADAATDAPAGDAADAAIDVPASDAADAATDAPAGDAGDAAVCESIDAFCATDASTGPTLNARCVRNWATAQTAAAWCPSGFNISIHSGCNGYDVVFQGGVDTSYTYVYDGASGALVSVSFNGLRGPSCVAGAIVLVDITGCADGGIRGPSICSADAGGG